MKIISTRSKEFIKLQGGQLKNDTSILQNFHLQDIEHVEKIKESFENSQSLSSNKVNMNNLNIFKVKKNSHTK